MDQLIHLGGIGAIGVPAQGAKRRNFQAANWQVFFEDEVGELAC
jgi:hypothetical protein